MSYMTLILALIMVESNGNDFEIGDNGAAFGCLLQPRRNTMERIS
jgi:hypothetical protein